MNPPDSDRKQLLDLQHKELWRQRDALVLDGPHLRPPAVRVVQTAQVLQVPRPLQTGQKEQKASQMEPATTRGD